MTSGRKRIEELIAQLERPPHVLALVHGQREQRHRQSGQELPAPSVS